MSAEIVYGRSTSRTCYVLNCCNNDKKLNKWLDAVCPTHRMIQEKFECSQPFDFISFPSNKIGRQRWINLLQRKDMRPGHGHKLLEPKASHRVCSLHFSCGAPSADNPDPDRNLGHSNLAEKRKLDNERGERYAKRIFSQSMSSDSDIFLASGSDILPGTPSTTTSLNINPTILKFIILTLLSILRKKNEQLKKVMDENILLKKKLDIVRANKNISPKLDFKLTQENLIKTDADAKYYTGFDSISIFNSMHGEVCKYIKRRWRGIKNTYKKMKVFPNSPSKFGPHRKFKSQDEFLVTLLCLRQGVQKKFVADLFGISTSLCSFIFHSWLSAMDNTITKHLLFWPSKEQIHQTKPKRFNSIVGIRGILDCVEFKIETPKDMALQSDTWSNYKHSNTGKALVVCAPNSMITFVSNVYGGHISDKEITAASAFLDKLDAGDVIMADKGFTIANECAAHNVTLYIPPGKRGVAQMTSDAVIKTKKIANKRILIEQVIRRIKEFRILKNVIPVSTVPFMANILRICASICNLRKPIYTD